MAENNENNKSVPVIFYVATGILVGSSLGMAFILGRITDTLDRIAAAVAK